MPHPLFRFQLSAMLCITLGLGCHEPSPRVDATSNQASAEITKGASDETSEPTWKPKLDWSNPAMSPYGASIGNVIRAYFLVGEFNELRKHIIYPACYTVEEIDHLLRTCKWGYDIDFTNLHWSADSTTFTLTYETQKFQTVGMEQYLGAVVNDSAKLFFHPNHAIPFVFTGRDAFEDLCILKSSLEGVFFAFDEARILPESEDALARIVGFFERHRDLQATIIGHTSSEGSSSHNQQLSEARAQAIYHHLKSSGIDVQRIDYFGRGATEPIYPNDTEENRARNRRVEIKIQE